MFLPVILWTDALVYVLLAVMLGAMLRVRRSPPLRAAWRRVWRNPAALSAALVLPVAPSATSIRDRSMSRRPWPTSSCPMDGRCASFRDCVMVARICVISMTGPRM